ncbi:hypothetical protein ABW19_dt0205858 [Dactylella cylindrospora]|nr:hypothetical protein ABW19_dt0205858 [Dactylella cylindrospora]
MVDRPIISIEFQAGSSKGQCKTSGHIGERSGNGGQTKDVPKPRYLPRGRGYTYTCTSRRVPFERGRDFHIALPLDSIIRRKHPRKVFCLLLRALPYYRSLLFLPRFLFFHFSLCQRHPNATFKTFECFSQLPR